MRSSSFCSRIFSLLFGAWCCLWLGATVQAQELSFEEIDQRLVPQALAAQHQGAGHWLQVRIATPQDWEGYIDADNWAYLYCYSQDSNGTWQKQQNGRFLKLRERATQGHQLYLPLRLQAQKSWEAYLYLEEQMGFYEQVPPYTLRLLSRAQAEKEERQRLWYQGIFLSAIFVMAFYNLFLFVSVRDRSTFYYVLSIVGIGLYFMFYYGFSIELLWPWAPRWNAYSFVIIVPLTRISWVLFTESYLNLRQHLPAWQGWLRVLIYLYLVPIALGLYSYYSGQDFSLLTVNLIGVLGVAVLSMMLLMGFLSLRKGFRAAYYFIIANLFFSVGSILFILREIHLLPDSFLTRYSVQIGVVFQVILFSLGLAYRLNSARQKLADEVLAKERLALEKEKEKQQLIEGQKLALAQEVAQRTLELQASIERLQSSEQSLKELNHLKDKLFSVVSHDLRSPLATLHSFLNIITRFKDQYSADDLEKISQKTQQAVHNLSLLLDNLLQWANAQMQERSPQMEALDLQEAIAATLEMVRISAEEKQIQIIPHALGSPVQVWSNPNTFGFVLRNLLMNAIKFTYPQGHIRLHISLEAHWIHLCIEDNGVGMSQEQQDKLLHSPLAPISTQGTAQERGMGLGWWLCRDFVQQWGGQLHLESQIGQGTKVSFSVPEFQGEVVAPHQI